MRCGAVVWCVCVAVVSVGGDVEWCGVVSCRTVVGMRCYGVLWYMWSRRMVC